MSAKCFCPLLKCCRQGRVTFASRGSPEDPGWKCTLAANSLLANPTRVPPELRASAQLAEWLGDGDEVPVTAAELKELLRGREELEAAVREKDELLGLIAHELRGPLHTILTAARRLAIPGLVVPGEVETVHELYRNTARIAVLLDNMLILAHGEQPAELEPVLLQRMLPGSSRSIACCSPAGRCSPTCPLTFQ